MRNDTFGEFVNWKCRPRPILYDGKNIATKSNLCFLTLT